MEGGGSILWSYRYAPQHDRPLQFTLIVNGMGVYACVNVATLVETMRVLLTTPGGIYGLQILDHRERAAEEEPK